MTTKISEASDRLCRAVQKIRSAVDDASRDALREIGYGPAFKPDGEPLSEDLLTECEYDVSKVEEIVRAYLATEEARVARLNRLAARFEALVSSLGVES